MSRSLNKRLLFRSATVTAALAAIAIIRGGAGCGGSSSTTSSGYVAYEDPYVYTSYYPADVAYANAYWANDWSYPVVYATGYGPSNPAPTAPAAPPTTTVDAGPSDAAVPATDGAVADAATTTDGGTSTSRLTSIPDLIRALARGDTTVCPGHVTVTPKTAAPPCTGDVRTQVRAGVTIVFNGCQIPNDGTVDGTVDVTSTQTASTPDCNSGTIITVSHQATITNLSLTGSGGSKLVIPNQTDQGANSFTFGQTPATLVIESNGQIQLFGPNGTALADLGYQNNRTFTFAGSASSYRLDGTSHITDNLRSGVTTDLTATGVTRVESCCRPVGGTLQIVRTGGAFPGTHNWTFNSTCGSATADGQTVTLPACI